MEHRSELEVTRLMQHLTTADTSKTQNGSPATLDRASTSTDIAAASRATALRRLPITRNLDMAMRYLRGEDKERTMWIDAICIHQSNIQERGDQVQQMAEVYTQASRVVVWLGPEDLDSTYAIDAFCELGNVANDDGAVGEEIRDVKALPVDEIGHIMMDSRSFHAIVHLLGCDWFERLWVRQEIYLGKKQGIGLCGHCEWPWLPFCKGIYAWCMTRLRFPGDPFGDMVLAAEMIVDRQGRGLLIMAREIKCSDPRDKVFAVLGMLTREDWDKHDTLRPDYSKTARDVYSDAFRYVMNTERSLHLLLCCEHTRNDLFRPTWSPNWGAPGLTKGPVNQYADANSALKVQDIGNWQLQASGCIATRVRTVKSTMTSRSGHYKKAFEQLKCHLKTVNLEAPYVISGDILDAYCYMLVGQSLQGHRNPPRRHQCSLAKVRTMMRHLAKGISRLGPLAGGVSELVSFKENVQWSCSGRSWMTTTDGHIGLAPSSVEPGDLICVLLGCPSLMALTPDTGSGRKVIGYCNVHGLNWGEALLGQVPQNTRLVWVKEVGPSNPEGWQFQDLRDGTMSRFDPRVAWDDLVSEPGHPDYTGYQVRDHGELTRYRKPDADYFQKRGMDIQDFLLI